MVCSHAALGIVVIEMIHEVRRGCAIQFLNSQAVKDYLLILNSKTK